MVAYKFVGVLFAAMVIVVLFTSYLNLTKIGHTMPISDRNSTEIGFAYEQYINVALLLRGRDTIKRAETMLKSMFYYQGRLNRKLPECEQFLDNIEQCRSLKFFPPAGVVLHILTDLDSLPLARSMLNQWKLQEFMRELSEIPNGHYAGVTPLLKLMLQNILPPILTKVILVDTDVIFNANIHELWGYFEKFKPENVIGMAFEPKPDECFPLGNSVIPPHGVNTGVNIYRLDRMNYMAFDEKWRKTLRNILNKERHLSMGEQTVINQMINDSPQIYYKLPCHWNTQVYFDRSTECCPATWPIRNPNEENCFPFSENVVRLLHFDYPFKPYHSHRWKWKWTIQKNHQGFLKVEDLRQRFREAYQYFGSIPLHCFK